MHLVFVYGTLLNNVPDFTDSAELLGPSEIRGSLYHLRWFPATQIDGSDNKIVGQVWTVDDAGLQILDRYEGYPNLYQKTLVDTEYGQATIYTMEELPDSATLVPDGDWLAYRARTSNRSAA